MNESTITVKVVDSIMGSGKTSAMINSINKADKSQKFMFITPYLSEVDRIREKCSARNFKSPVSMDGSKINGIKYLLNNKENIISTHALFHLFDDEVLELIRLNEYILIMDEVTDVVEPYNITKDDIDDILNISKYAHVDENHFIIWDKPDYYGRFSDLKRLCDIRSVVEYNNNVVIWLFPIKSFRAFKEIFVLTYLFDGQIQKWYYDFHDVEYKWYYATYEDGVYKIRKRPADYKPQMIDKSLIQICDNDKLNRIGDPETALSVAWYQKAQRNSFLKDLRNNTLNWFKHIANGKSNLNLWTTFKEYKTKLQGKGYTKSYISMNMRASNDYKDRTVLAYLCNRYVNPVTSNFFTFNNIPINQDMFALSEMLQWIWRSAIRDGKPIKIYIPSKRMRNLLINWLNTGEISSEDRTAAKVDEGSFIED